MIVRYSKNFVKQYDKLSAKTQGSVLERLELFRQNPLTPKLRNHQLQGKNKVYRSINITGDVRALYLLRDDEAIFDAVGTHSQLYG